MKRILSILIVLTIVLTSFSVTSFAAEEKAALPTITVDMKNEQHNIIHGAAGFLYGISNEGVPDVNTLTPLKPKVLATKGALGTEHPYGDALDVAEEAANRCRCTTPIITVYSELRQMLMITQMYSKI